MRVQSCLAAFIGILILALIALLGGVALINYAKTSATEARIRSAPFCAVVERYFAVREKALATFDTSDVESTAAGYVLIEITREATARQQENDPLYYQVSIGRCDIDQQGDDAVRLLVGYEEDYHDKPPALPVSKTTQSLRYLAHFHLTKIDGVWKVSKIESLEDWL